MAMGKPTFDEIRGPIERIVYIALGWVVARGYLSSDVVGDYATLVLAVAAAVYGWYQNRPKAIMQSAEALPTTVRIISTDQKFVDDKSLPKTVAQ